MRLDNEQVRKQKLVVVDEQTATAVLLAGRVGYLGLVDGDEPYVVPLNYVWHEDAVYVHGAQSGRKAALMTPGTRASFTVAEDGGVIANPVPAKTDTAYRSVMVFGQISVVADLTEATVALDAMLHKYVPGYYERPLAAGHVRSYLSSAGSHTAVFRLQPDHITAKHNPPSLDMMFFAGRTQRQDAQEQVMRRRRETQGRPHGPQPE